MILSLFQSSTALISKSECASSVCRVSMLSVLDGGDPGHIPYIVRLMSFCHCCLLCLCHHWLVCNCTHTYLSLPKATQTQEDITASQGDFCSFKFKKVIWVVVGYFFQPFGFCRKCLVRGTSQYENRLFQQAELPSQTQQPEIKYHT